MVFPNVGVPQKWITHTSYRWAKNAATIVSQWIKFGLRVMIGFTEGYMLIFGQIVLSKDISETLSRDALGILSIRWEKTKYDN